MKKTANRRALGLLMVGLLAGEPGCRRGEQAAPPSPPGQDPPALRGELQAALRAKGAKYVPRTRHKNADGSPRYTNRLIRESSPYLLQHAHNPVNWFPWGEEAFERARALGRSIFLSIGYSTCHWCHVMEEESFEDEEIAQTLNDHFVAIKVDREERPDIDAVYMAFLQSFTGGGGWPMSVWLTPAREPFFGGTYFPPRAGVRGATQGFIDVLSVQARRFVADGAAVAAEAKIALARLRAATTPEPSGDYPSAAAFSVARTEAVIRFDPVTGGARGEPKFPSAFPLRLLLRIARRTRDAEASRMVTVTLDQMRAGGIYDQVGGGFHRYATDERWLLPHFEKMLYDNADLALAYLEAGQATGERRFTATARETLDYLLRDMQAPDGSFYSATDADSATAEGRRKEGVFFTWTPAELVTVLGAEDARLAEQWYGVTGGGHLQMRVPAQVDGRSVLHTARPLADVARDLGVPPARVEERLPSIRARLLAARSKREAPGRDEKVIVGWNGLAISAFARAAIALGDAGYGAAAVRAARAVAGRPGDHRPLPHLLVDGKPGGPGFGDDHVFMAAALLDVFELTADEGWLFEARALMETVEQSFADPIHGGYFLTAEHHERLPLREKPDRDGPTPSISSVAALNWLRLRAATGEDRLGARAETTLRAFSRVLPRQPLQLDRMLLALDWATDSVKQIVVVVPEGRGALAPAARPLLDVLIHSFVPNVVLVVATEADLTGELGNRVPWARDKKLRAGRATAYVCQWGTCKLPTTDPAQLAAQLAHARVYP
ncbi:MAG: thioredoxin domain-containing protein [Pseudomonadota bacterium]